MDEPSGKIKAYNIASYNTSVGGPTYDRFVRLALELDWKPDDKEEPDWTLSLSISSQDSGWLASRSRADVSALVGLDSAIK